MVMSPWAPYVDPSEGSAMADSAAQLNSMLDFQMLHMYENASPMGQSMMGEKTWLISARNIGSFRLLSSSASFAGRRLQKAYLAGD